MSGNLCNFCERKFSSPQNLSTHQKTAKYCLALRKDIVTQKREYKCEYCEHILTQKSSLERHYGVCPGYKDDVIEKLEIKYTEEITKYKEEIAKKNEIIAKKNALIKEQRAKILELEKNLSHEKGIIVGMEKTKAPKVVLTNNNNNSINKKVLMMPITHVQPLTLSYVKSRADEFDYKMYLKGKKGIKQHIYNLITYDMEDGTVQKNYVHTDASRNVYSRLMSNKEWKKDDGARFLNNILNSISDKVKEHDISLRNDITSKGGYGPKTESLARLETDLLPIYSGIVDSKSQQRTDLFEDIRKDIRDICSPTTESVHT